MTHCQNLRRRGRHELRIVERAEVDEPDAIAIRVRYFGSRLQREARFADAAGARQRQQTVFCQQPLDVDELALAADEGRERQRQLSDAIALCGLRQAVT